MRFSVALIFIARSRLGVACASARSFSSSSNVVLYVDKSSLSLAWRNRHDFVSKAVSRAQSMCPKSALLSLFIQWSSCSKGKSHKLVRLEKRLALVHVENAQEGQQLAVDRTRTFSNRKVASAGNRQFTQQMTPLLLQRVRLADPQTDPIHVIVVVFEHKSEMFHHKGSKF
ncbi:hypothetical protein TcasGA2_TC008196 [Tribolium castaneum]|uniref:Secreted protein n=1 Tax=Tribolium castaneum TaxID=7070 RepID=D2A0D7_TRICA|nr:hypothetical protein TcasGA2_TC008196 [Tribolium castaneum]